MKRCEVRVASNCSHVRYTCCRVYMRLALIDPPVPNPIERRVSFLVWLLGIRVRTRERIKIDRREAIVLASTTRSRHLSPNESWRNTQRGRWRIIAHIRTLTQRVLLYVPVTLSGALIASGGTLGLFTFMSADRTNEGTTRVAKSRLA